MMRSDSWRLELLDRSGHAKGDLPTAVSGSLQWSIFRSVQGTGSVELTAAPGVEIDWLRDRVRISHIGAGRTTPMGVWLISMPGWKREGPVTRTTLALADKTEALNTPIGSWVTVPTGIPVVANVVEVIRGRGEQAIAFTPSTAVTTVAMTWEPQDTYLKLCNDLLKTINYSPLWADLDGRLRIDPYILPGDRPVVASYGGGDDQLRMLPDWEDEADVFRLPTGVRIYVPGSDKAPGFVGRADLPREHPLSAHSRGREILLVEQAEVVSQQVADALAQRRLAETIQVTRRVTITHPIDGTTLNDVVLHDPLGLRAAIVERTVKLSVGAVVTSVLRHIHTGGQLPWT
ncbi:MAG: hypothetical protein Q4D79_00175 [Propionibacteriaceae bacterium]|nr:hypothetical protein [Propionibacteriaceae bacterium]